MAFSHSPSHQLLGKHFPTLISRKLLSIFMKREEKKTIKGEMNRVKIFFLGGGEFYHKLIFIKAGSSIRLKVLWQAFNKWVNIVLNSNILHLDLEWIVLWQWQITSSKTFHDHDFCFSRATSSLAGSRWKLIFVPRENILKNRSTFSPRLKGWCNRSVAPGLKLCEQVWPESWLFQGSQVYEAFLIFGIHRQNSVLQFKSALSFSKNAFPKALFCDPRGKSSLKTCHPYWHFSGVDNTFQYWKDLLWF